MPALKNVVAVDWRSGKDRCYFFFKDSNTYSRFDIGANRVADGHPVEVKESNWGRFHTHVKNLRFGFATTGIAPDTVGAIDDDVLWLFYYDKGVPMVCKFDQDLDEVRGLYPVSKTLWAPLLPYFNRIVAGTWWQLVGHSQAFRFLMNDGHSVAFDYKRKHILLEKIDANSWPGLSHYKDRIITAVQNDRTFADSYYYIFLTNNQYIRYNIQRNRAESGPINVDEESWPGLLDD
ncbi:hypothetical protein [Pseudomonas sp. PD9R]|uniref:hypothetical protein n=1 Tax=Pseudomonas sp. PD9R TaxID=2853534 RepID=UPI001C44C5AF|nr:hypothetical protein [Pseudomonas sp. PD9R]MBV6825516.1 hypothetical protein [Pseudomonas sp. PD9R]